MFTSGRPAESLERVESLAAERVAALRHYEDGHALVRAGAAYGGVDLLLVAARAPLYPGEAHARQDVRVVRDAEAAHQNSRMTMAMSRP